MSEVNTRFHCFYQRRSQSLETFCCKLVTSPFSFHVQCLRESGTYDWLSARFGIYVYADQVTSLPQRSTGAECSDSIVGGCRHICSAHNPVTEQPYGSGCSGYENKVGKSLWAQQVPDSPLVTDGTRILNCDRQPPSQHTRSSKHINPGVTDKSIPNSSHDSDEVLEEGRIYKL